MSPPSAFAHPDGYRAREFRCPLLHPRPTGQPCAHEQFVKGPGCVKQINIERGGLMRALLDRDSAAYKGLYDQRTCAERINSQATALGIERPKVRNRRSVRTLNTLIYIAINVQALARVRLAKARAPALMLC